jgi:hypothetical protein
VRPLNIFIRKGRIRIRTSDYLWLTDPIPEGQNMRMRIPNTVSLLDPISRFNCQTSVFRDTAPEGNVTRGSKSGALCITQWVVFTVRSRIPVLCIPDVQIIPICTNDQFFLLQIWSFVVFSFKYASIPSHTRSRYRYLRYIKKIYGHKNVTVEPGSVLNLQIRETGCGSLRSEKWIRNSVCHLWKLNKRYDVKKDIQEEGWVRIGLVSEL